MTIIKINANSILMGILSYIGFIWGISWRTAFLSLIAAVLCGVALGVLSTINAWPPEMLETIAPFIGLPVTLSVFAIVLVKQIFKIIK